MRLNVCQVVPVQDVRDGKVKPRDTKKLDGGNAPSTAPAVVTAPAANVYAGPIPFN